MGPAQKGDSKSGHRQIARRPDDEDRDIREFSQSRDKRREEGPFRRPRDASRGLCFHNSARPGLPLAYVYRHATETDPMQAKMLTELESHPIANNVPVPAGQHGPPV